MTIDQATDTIYVADLENGEGPGTVSVIDAATCNAVTSSSCSPTQPKLPAGRAPAAVAVNPAAGTIYVSNGDGTVSIIPAIRLTRADPAPSQS